METQDFEQSLENLSKPKVPVLKHRDQLAQQVQKARFRLTVSVWWLLIPAYLMATLFMKQFFAPPGLVDSPFRAWIGASGMWGMAGFVFLPLAAIYLNIREVRKIHYLAGHPRLIAFLQMSWLHLAAILVALFFIVAYFL